MLTVVTYHYVRPVPDVRGFRMRGRTPEQFEAQVDALRRSHTLIGLPDLLRAVREGAPLPPRAALLTFDDGLADHATWVTPILHRRGLSGCFFVTADAVERRRLLPVHQIHCLLAGGTPAERLLARLFAMLPELAGPGTEFDETTLRSQHARPGEWDDASTMCLKRLLQRELPDALRTLLLERLFSEFVTSDPVGFAEEFYVGAEAIGGMLDAGMQIGGHGATHRWLSHLAPAEQAMEVAASKAMLERLGVSTDLGWSFSYPYGGHDAGTEALLERAGCSVAFTVERAAVTDLAPRLRLPRLDTNDLPLA